MLTYEDISLMVKRAIEMLIENENQRNWYWNLYFLCGAIDDETHREWLRNGVSFEKVVETVVREVIED